MGVQHVLDNPISTCREGNASCDKLKKTQTKHIP